MKNIFLVFLLFCSASLKADTVPYTTQVDIQAYVPLGTNNSAPNVYNTNAASSLSYQGQDSAPNGAVFFVNNSGAASRGTLHSSSSYNIQEPFLCNNLCPILNAFSSTDSIYTEIGVKATSVASPDLLAGIVAYKATFKLDGSFAGNPYANVEITGSDCQTSPFVSTCISSNAVFVDVPPLGPVSFYIVPPDPLATFTALFDLRTLEDSYGFLSGSANFYNTATLTSFVAVDANNNAIPGVEFLLSDGTLLGADGYSNGANTPPASITPEPSPVVLSITGLLFFGFLRADLLRRRLRMS